MNRQLTYVVLGRAIRRRIPQPSVWVITHTENLFLINWRLMHPLTYSYRQHNMSSVYIFLSFFFFFHLLKLLKFPIFDFFSQLLYFSISPKAMNGFYRALSVAANRHMPRPKSHEDPEPEPSAEQIETMKDVSDSYSRVESPKEGRVEKERGPGNHCCLDK